MRLFGDFRRRGLAGADRPDRLVREDQRRHGRGGKSVEAARQLGRQHFFGAVAGAFGVGLADADNRLEARRERGLDAGVHGLVGLAEILAAFAVADDDVFDAGLLEHGRGDLAGERAGFGPVDVLRADLDVAAGGRLDHRRKRGEGRADDDVGLARADVRDQRLQRFDQRFAFGGGLVHFPVTGDDDFAHFSLDFLMVVR